MKMSLTMTLDREAPYAQRRREAKDEAHQTAHRTGEPHVVYLADGGFSVASKRDYLAWRGRADYVYCTD